MNDYYTNEQIIIQICKERIKLAERRENEQYLPRFIGSQTQSTTITELDAMLPPRRQWNAFRPRHRPEGNNANLKALIRAAMELREDEPDQPWVGRQNGFIESIKARVFDGGTLTFDRPQIAWLQKSGNEYRALCNFQLQDKVIIGLFAAYLRDKLDPGFSRSSYAFRSRNASGYTPTHHDAFNVLYNLRRSNPGRDLYVCEIDIRGFFDTVDHEVALAVFISAVQRLNLHPGAMQIFQAYLNCYNFPDNVLADALPTLQRKNPNAYFPWPIDALPNYESRTVGVPQGGAISGVIANMILDFADKRVEEVREQLGAEIHYLRYCDDMILLSPSKSHCQIALQVYLNALEHLKLPYHKPESLSIYRKQHWAHKSKDVYCWTGRKSFNCVPWIQFVGYQIRYDGLTRPRKGAVKKQAEKFVELTDRTKYGLLKASSSEAIKASQSQVLRSFAHKLAAKGVGRIDTYSDGPSPMSWSAGFKALHEKPFIQLPLKQLDRLRQKQIMRLADAQINYGPGRSCVSSRNWNPVGYLNSYCARFKNVGGRDLILHPWRPLNKLDYVKGNLFMASLFIVDLPNTIKLQYKFWKKSILRIFKAKAKVDKEEVWQDNHPRRSERLYLVLEVRVRIVKCQKYQTKQIRYLPRYLFSSIRFTRITDADGNYCGH